MITVLLCVAFGLGVALERRREDGSNELRVQLRVARAELRRVRHELDARRQASMSRHPSALPAPRSLTSSSATPSLHLVPAGSNRPPLRLLDGQR